jgi:hypothetical protein
MKYRHFYLILLAFLLLDTTYSFLQHYHEPLDGDMTGIILPSEACKPLMEDPFGFNVLLKDQEYKDPNRFFAHWFMSKYYKTIPFLLQYAVDPITSLYLASAIMKILIQVLIIWILASLISGSRSIFNRDFIIAAFLVMPMIQVGGSYYLDMGIIDRSITYAMFYALPLGLLLVFFSPFYKASHAQNRIKLKPVPGILLILLAIVLSFNGPLIPGLVLVICSGILMHKWWTRFISSKKTTLVGRSMEALHQIPNAYLLYFGIFMALSLYSLYLTRNNITTLEDTLAISDRYLGMPKGLFFQLTSKPGFLFLFMLVALNVFIIFKQKESTGRSWVLQVFVWILILSVVYIVLLPLGGYKHYRPYTIRRDTFGPVTLALIYFYALSSYFIINQAHLRYKWAWYAVLSVFILIFSNADISPLNRNDCEREALETLRESNEEVTMLNDACTVLGWEPIGDYGGSELNAEMLEFWGVTKGKKLYYQGSGQK